MASDKATNINNSNSGRTIFDDVLLNVQFENPATVRDINTGWKIAKAIYQAQTVSVDNMNFFRARAVRINELQRWAKGSQNVQENLDYMNVSDGNKSYIQMDMTPQRIAPKFVGVLEESMSKVEEYPCIKAVDDDSVAEKKQRLKDALYRMHEAAVINDMSQKAGMPLEPPHAYVPDNEIAAQVYFELKDQLPKEIKFEQILAKSLNDNDYQKVLRRQQIRDFIINNMGVTKVEKIRPNEYYIRRCLSQNVIYNFFMGETGKLELNYIGEVYSLRIRELRQKYTLTQDQELKLARAATRKNIGQYNFQWRQEYTFNYTRPWDDFSILVFDFEYNVAESQYYVNKKDVYGGDNIKAKNGIPKPTSDKAEIIKKGKNTWYHGIYACDSDIMMYWGLPDIQIRPYTDIYTALSSYSINILNNDGEYVPSLFERIIEPLREYSIVKLKRKQAIVKLRPDGIRIDVESIRNIDLGAGDSIDWEEVVRIYDQTGNELWSSKGINPLEREAPPFSNTVRGTAIETIIGLTNTLAGIVAEIRDLIGVPTYRDGSDVGDRTAARLAEGQNASSFNVTDFIVNGQHQLMEDTLHKICILAWNDAINSDPDDQDDLINTKFDVNVKMRMTDYEKQLMEQNIQTAMQQVDSTGQPLISFKDAFMIRQIDNYKLACLYLSATEEKNRADAIAKSQALQQQNAQVQQASLQLKAQADKEADQLKADLEMRKQDELAKGQKEVAATTSLFAMVAKGEQIPPELQGLYQALIQNIQFGLQMENAQQQAAVQQGAQQAMQDKQAAAQQQGAQQTQMQ
jgi:hypothetical protein